MDANTKATTMTNSRILLDVTERLEAEECDPGTPFVRTRTEYIDGDRVETCDRCGMVRVTKE